MIPAEVVPAEIIGPQQMPLPRGQEPGFQVLFHRVTGCYGGSGDSRRPQDKQVKNRREV